MELPLPVSLRNTLRLLKVMTTKYKFDASSSLKYHYISWDFGDGKKAGKGNIAFGRGKYKVKLTISDGKNSDTELNSARTRKGGGDGGGEGVNAVYKSATRCLVFKVINQNQATKTIVAEFQKPATCKDVFIFAVM